MQLTQCLAVSEGGGDVIDVFARVLSVSAQQQQQAAAAAAAAAADKHFEQCHNTVSSGLLNRTDRWHPPAGKDVILRFKQVQYILQVE